MNMRTPVFFMLLFLLNFYSPLFAEDEKPVQWGGVIGVSPTTMGTLGETIQLNLDLFKYLRLSTGGGHEKILQEDLDFEKLGSDLKGDLTQETWAGNLQLGAIVRFLSLEWNPFVSYDFFHNASSSTSRIIEKPQSGNDAYPQDTYAFLEYTETELLRGPHLGLQIQGDKQSSLILFLQATYSPLMLSDVELDYFQNLTGPLPASGEQVTYMWRDNQSFYQCEGTRLQLQGSSGIYMDKPAITLSGFGRYSFASYSGSAWISNTLYSPFSDLTTGTTLDIFQSTNDLFSKLSIESQNIEAGLSFTLHRFPAAPTVEIAYARLIRDVTYNFPLTSPPTAEKWIEDYDYYKLNMKWGF